MCKVSVIVPVYKVEDFVGRCVRSLMEQTLDDVEFIFVDDASPDVSMDIVRNVVAEYPGRIVRYAVHEENRGLPSARNTGLALASGEFVYHCDSDDWVEKDTLEAMYNAASESGADFVYCDFYLSFEKNERYMGNPAYSTPDEVLRKGFLGGSMKYNVWNKLIRRKLYEGISFPDGHGMGEDMTVIMLVMKAKGVSYVPKALYHYVKLNGEAFSNSTSQKKLDDIRFNVDRVSRYLIERYGADIEEDLCRFKLGVKLPFLMSDRKEDYRRWAQWYPEADAYAMACTQLPFRTRLLQWMAGKGQWWYVRMYYEMLYKLLYGVIYR